MEVAQTVDGMAVDTFTLISKLSKPRILSPIAGNVSHTTAGKVDTVASLIREDEDAAGVSDSRLAVEVMQAEPAPLVAESVVEVKSARRVDP
jgi:hypothetical protein